MGSYYCDAATILVDIPTFSGQERIDTATVVTWEDQPYNYINARLGGVYDVPFGTGSSTPPIIKDIATLLLQSKVIKVIYYSEDPEDPENARAEALKQEALDMLQQILDGELAILSTGNAVIEEDDDKVGEPWSSTTDTDKIFVLSEDPEEWDLKVYPPTGTNWTTTEDGHYL